MLFRSPVAADAIPPPPILPLPSHIEIPAPHLERVDSTSSLNVEPPTPAPAPVSTFAPPPATSYPQPTPQPLATPIPQAPVASSSGQVYAPATPMEDVVMGDGGLPREISPVMKRGAPGEEGFQVEAKRQKVDPVPVRLYSCSLATRADSRSLAGIVRRPSSFRPLPDAPRSRL